MAWLFGPKRTPSEHRNAEASRDRQIANLYEKVPALQRKSTDNSLFEVQIQAPPSGAKVMLRVFLPTKFPSERPVLQLLSPVSHPWVNQYMQVVGHPELGSWDPVSPPLMGDIVSDVITEFGRSCSRRGPPEHVSPTEPSKSSPPKATIRDHGPKQQSGGAHTPIPPIPRSFDELQGMSVAHLDRLLGDDVARRVLLVNMPSVVGMKEFCTEVRKGNMETARSTLSKHDEALRLRKGVEQMRMMLQVLQSSYEGKAQGRNKNLGGTADQVILKQVKQSSKLADMESERSASKFLEKLSQPNEFLDIFLKERQRYHMLAAKIECMKRDIRF